MFEKLVQDPFSDIKHSERYFTRSHINMYSRQQLIDKGANTPRQEDIKLWHYLKFFIIPSLLVIFLFLYIWAVLNSDVDGERIFGLIILSIMILNMSSTCSKANSHRRLEQYVFLACGLISNVAFTGIGIYTQKWTVTSFQLCVLGFIMMCPSLTALAKRYPESRCSNWPTNIIKLFKWLSFFFALLVIIFYIALVFEYGGVDVEGYLGLLQALLVIIVLGLVAEHCLNVLLTKTSYIMNLLFLICGIGFLVMETINIWKRKGWGTEAIILLCCIITPVLINALQYRLFFEKKVEQDVGGTTEEIAAVLEP